MNRVSEVMKEHSGFCSTEARVAEIKFLMQKYDYKEMPVLNAEHVPVGLINFDAVSDFALDYLDQPFYLKAEELMKHITVSVKKETTIGECLRVMEANHLTIIPVVDEEEHYCGVVKKTDIIMRAAHTSSISAGKFLEPLL